MEGYKACPVCEEDIFFLQLKYSRKIVYLGSWRFLPMSHRYRRLQKVFSGSTEEGRAPKALTGEVVYQRVNHLRASYGKGKKLQLKRIYGRRGQYILISHIRNFYL